MSVRPSMRCALPSTCSGDMNDGVPLRMPISDDCAWPVMASPKSTSTGPRSRVRMMFAGLDVAMDDRALVGVGQGLGHAGDNLRRFPPGHRPTLHPLVQRLAIEQVRDDEAPSVLDADVEDRQDAAMTEPGEVARLAHEDVQVGGLHRGKGYLDGHLPLQVRVVARVNGAESPGPADAAHLVAPELHRLAADGGIATDRIGRRQLRRRVVDEIR